MTTVMKRVRIREIMQECGIQRGTADFYESIDKAMAMVLYSILDDAHTAYPKTRLTSEHLAKLSQIKGGYYLLLEQEEADPEVAISGIQASRLNDEEVEEPGEWD